jgi:hypothetical protein
MQTLSPTAQAVTVGNYVCVKHKQKEELDIPAKQLVLRVAEVRPSEVLILQGKCGTKRVVHATHRAPCHLPEMGHTIDPLLRLGPAEAVWEKCCTDDVATMGLLLFCMVCAIRVGIYGTTIQFCQWCPRVPNVSCEDCEG